ncbi:MAG: hypothetical protein JW751_24485 [Polyangiaceae bacterium]|nr:hypothetical protein [Polyangiaceae bacterium]
MARQILVFTALAAPIVACGSATYSPEPRSADRAPPVAEAAASHAVRMSRDLLDRRVGDLLVYRFSGDYRGEPITVTEEIAARDQDQFVVDYTLASGDDTARFRVRRTVAGFAVISVAKLEGTTESPIDHATFDAWIEQTRFTADANVGRLSRGEETCLVGEQAHDCTVARYQVLVGDERAILTVATSADLPGRSLAGVIATDDGAEVYRAELVELHRGGSTAAVRAER